jgi:hypothetical protein
MSRSQQNTENDTWRWANRETDLDVGLPPHPSSCVVIGSAESRRTSLFQAALSRLDLPPATIIPYRDLLNGRITLPEVVRPGGLVRIDSPDKDFEGERALLAAGAEEAAAESVAHLSGRAVEELTFDRGRLLPSRQWYLGFCRALRLIEEQLTACAPHRLMNRASDIEVMFDKPRCRDRLARAGIAVPPCLGVIRCYEELRERMRQAAWGRVFVKLAHGSSASGVVAYQTDGQRQQATTTVEMVRQEGELCLYNSRRIRVYREPREIAELIDALCRHRAHVEQWLPKAGLDGQTFDLRVVVIAGAARHVVARLSRSPMTNLHLLNARAEAGKVRERMGSAAWEAALQSCERAMTCFAGSLYAGLDLLIAPGYRRHAVLEMNAFGDLLPGLLWDGQDTYTVEVAAMREGSEMDGGAGRSPVEAAAC